MLSVKLQQS